MSVTVLFHVKSTPATRAQVRQGFLDILPDTRSYDGCEALEFITDQDDPDTFVVWERWQSRKQYEAYLKWRTDSGTVGKLVPLLAGAPSVTYFDTVRAYP